MLEGRRRHLSDVFIVTCVVMQWRAQFGSEWRAWRPSAALCDIITPVGGVRRSRCLTATSCHKPNYWVGPFVLVLRQGGMLPQVVIVVVCLLGAVSALAGTSVPCAM